MMINSLKLEIKYYHLKIIILYQAKKKNRNEIDTKEKGKDEIIIDNEDKIETEDNVEIKEIKQNIINNSINRFKIHKIKFKYKPKWLEEISKYS